MKFMQEFQEIAKANRKLAKMLRMKQIKVKFTHTETKLPVLINGECNHGGAEEADIYVDVYNSGNGEYEEKVVTCIHCSYCNKRQHMVAYDDGEYSGRSLEWI